VTRVCRACGKELPLEQFVRDSYGKDGRANTCRPCNLVYQRRMEAKRRVKHGSQTDIKRRIKRLDVSITFWWGEYMMQRYCASCKREEGAATKAEQALERKRALSALRATLGGSL
jgi:hypothetical protein